MGVMQDIIIKDLEYWEKLLIELGVEELRVLEIVNDNETITLSSIIKELKLKYKLNFCKNKVRRILKLLEQRELLRLIRSIPLCITQMRGIEDNIKKLIILGKERYKLK